jgi:hypothetical protein
VIRIHRGPPPSALASVRAEELRRVRDARGRGVPYELGDRYNSEEVRQALYAAQAWKCCYCEILIQPRAYPIEHFRPKGKAKHGPTFPDHEGYWWLTWTWENLMLACPTCNSTKLDHFPLEPRGRVLPRGRKPPGPERAMLLDPMTEDPTASIEFAHRGGHWMPFPRNGCLRGAATIRSLGLSTPTWLNRYDDFVAEFIEPKAAVIRARIAGDDHPGVAAAWNEATRFLLGPRSLFKALSYDVLNQEFSPGVRARFGLILPRP